MASLRSFLAPALRTLFQRSPLASSLRSFHSLVPMQLGLLRTRPATPSSAVGDFNRIVTREMNRNARRPKKANHGKRPVSHVRRRVKKMMIKSRAYRKKIFGYWF